jgi:hypothetical protein
MLENNFSNSPGKWNELLLPLFIKEMSPILVLSTYFNKTVFVRYIEGEKKWFLFETE